MTKRKTCPVCHNLKPGNKEFCSEYCEAEYKRQQALKIEEQRRREREIERKYQKAKWAAIQKEIIKYNKAHGTNLSYGQYVAMKEMGANYGRSKVD